MMDNLLKNPAFRIYNQVWKMVAYRTIRGIKNHNPSWESIVIETWNWNGQRHLYLPING